jgi:hypothetical protein
MKKHLILAFSLAFTPVLFAEGPADDVKAAAKKLAESSYSWTTSTPAPSGSDRGGMSTEGKTDKSGVALIVNKFGDRSTESVIKAGKVAVKTEEGWKSGEELSARAPGGEGGGGRRGGGGFAARMAENFKAPAAEAETLATGAKELKKDGDAISGDLTEEAAKARLTFGGRRRGGEGGNAPPAPSNAKGSVKFWIKDGALTKYEVTVSGSFERDGETRDFSRTTTTEIKDAGTAALEIPAEATAKLGSADAAPEKKKDTEEKKAEEKKKDEI